MAVTPNLRKKKKLFKTSCKSQGGDAMFFFLIHGALLVYIIDCIPEEVMTGSGKQKECLMKIYLYSHQWRNPWDRTCQIVCEISPAICCFSIHHLLMHSFVENPSVKFYFCQSSSPGDRKKDEIEYCIICLV